MYLFSCNVYFSQILFQFLRWKVSNVKPSDVVLEEVKSSEDEVWEGGNQKDVDTNSNDQEAKILEVKETLECYLNSLCAFQVSSNGFYQQF